MAYHTAPTPLLKIEDELSSLSAYDSSFVLPDDFTTPWSSAYPPPFSLSIVHRYALHNLNYSSPTYLAPQLATNISSAHMFSSPAAFYSVGLFFFPFLFE
jgi:hypothetical protein